MYRAWPWSKVVFSIGKVPGELAFTWRGTVQREPEKMHRTPDSAFLNQTMLQLFQKFFRPMFCTTESFRSYINKLSVEGVSTIQVNRLYRNPRIVKCWTLCFWILHIWGRSLQTEPINNIWRAPDPAFPNSDSFSTVRLTGGQSKKKDHHRHLTHPLSA